jgi:hypothetical protein
MTCRNSQTVGPLDKACMTVLLYDSAWTSEAKDEARR